MIRSISLGAIVLSFAVVLTAAPASAGVGVPDTKVAKVKSGPYKGNNIYNETGAGQTVKKNAHPGDVRRFFFKVENDGAGAEELHFDATFDNFDDFTYRYFRGSTEITAEVIGTGTKLIELDPGQQAVFSVRIKVKNGADTDVYNERAGLGDESDEDYDVAGYKVKVV